MSKYITDKRYFMILVFLILVVTVIFLTLIYWPAIPHPEAAQKTAEFGTSVTLTPTALPTHFQNFSPDYFENQNTTNGLLIGSVVLVAVILLGVLISIRNNEK